MGTDRFYQDILKGLSSPLDASEFERCAVDLLRADFPGIAPVPGGNDAGMDGAVPDFDGEPFPVVCTTAKDCAANLRNSLDSYVANGLLRRKVLFVTSRPLSAAHVRRLNQIARDRGFVLVQVFEQEAIAQRLYRNQRWCRSLLNLNGIPSPISKIAPNLRTDFSAQLLGRDADLAWLRSMRGDSILSGQPASGKTSLLAQFAAEPQHFFLQPGYDVGMVAGAIREFSPSAIILDDAHAYPEELERLKRLRLDSGGTFHIIASTWPSGIDSLRTQMELPESRCRSLKQLPRETILEIVKATQLRVADEVFAEIVNQAHGKPGLAARLAIQCLDGEFEELFNGDLLVRSVMQSLHANSGSQPKEILAAFAMGGDLGLTLSAVANSLEIPVIELSQIVAHLDAAGVLTESRDRLIVRPHALRFCLVRDVFFSGAKSIPSDALMQTIEFKREVALTVLGAKFRGAEINDAKLLRLVSDADDVEVWSTYAHLGRYECEWILSNRPDLDLSIAPAGLRHCAEKIIPRLMERALGDLRELGANPGHPLRLIQDWVRRVRPGSAQAVENRKSLIRAVLRWLDAERDVSVAYAALPIAFCLSFEWNSSDPGAGNTLILRHGHLLASDISSLESEWDRVMVYLRAKSENIIWKDVLRILDEVRIRPYRREVSPSTIEAAKQLAARIIADVAELSRDRPSIQSRLKSKAADFGIELKIKHDELFDTLFPERRDFYAEEKIINAEIKKLAISWKDRDPKQVAVDIQQVEVQASEVGMTYPRLTTQLSTELASIVDAPLAWAKIFLQMGLPSDLTFSFMSGSMHRNIGDWPLFFESHLCELLVPYSVPAILMLEDPPTSLLEAALGNLLPVLGRLDHTVGLMPEPTAQRLLTHPECLVRQHAAIGEWLAGEKSLVRSYLLGSWRVAIVESDISHYWLGEILGADQSLALDWIGARFQNHRVPYESAELVKALAAKLPLEHRVDLAGMLDDEWPSRELVRSLVQSDWEVAEVIVKTQKDNQICLELADLFGSTDAWVKRVKLLRDSGIDTATITSYAVVDRGLWEGPESARIRNSLVRFEFAKIHEDEFIQHLGVEIHNKLSKRLSIALDNEEQASIHGRF